MLGESELGRQCYYISDGVEIGVVVVVLGWRVLSN